MLADHTISQPNLLWFNVCSHDFLLLWMPDIFFIFTTFIFITLLARVKINTSGCVFAYGHKLILQKHTVVCKQRENESINLFALGRVLF
jgi:hypothetical protein